MTQWVLIAAAVLWPLIAFLGGQGYSVLLPLVAVLCLPVAVPKMRPRLYMVALLLALAFAAASAFWSPRAISLSDFMPSGGFAVHFDVLRVALGLLWTAVLFAAVTTLARKQADAIVLVAAVVLLIQLVAVVVLTVFERQALAFFYPGVVNPVEGVQNLSRNVLVMALATPLLCVGIGRVLSFSRTAAVAAGALATVLILAVLFTRGVHAGIVSLAAGLLAAGVVRLFPRHGFRVLGGMLAAVVVATPFVLAVVTRGADALTATTSAEWRLAIWNRVLEVIQQNPLFGRGLGVLRTMDEKIPSGAFKDELFVPNHAHNMVLQLWAETGAIGATLVAVTLLLAGFRMPQPGSLGVAGFLAASLAGQFMAVALVSFDLWNDWWWACTGLLAVFIIAVARAGASSAAAQPAGG